MLFLGEKSYYLVTANFIQLSSSRAAYIYVVLKFVFPTTKAVKSYKNNYKQFGQFMVKFRFNEKQFIQNILSIN